MGDADTGTEPAGDRRWPDVRVLHRAGPGLRRRVLALAAVGRGGLDDQLRADLLAGGRPGFLAAVVDGPGGDGAPPLAYGQATRTAAGTLLGAVVDHEADPELARTVLEAVVAGVAAEGGGQVDYWVTDPSPGDEATAASLGLHPDRTLLRMERPLPLPDSTVPAATRPFHAGDPADEDAWLAVNNRAFAGHPEQGGWDRTRLRDRQAEPWFDPDGLRMLEVDGVLAGSCWTKLHPGTGPPVGEIYVIAVDPAFAGRGLGRGLVAAGLAWLAARGAAVGMLYVDEANASAVGLYRSLGFTVTQTATAYAAVVPMA